MPYLPADHTQLSLTRVFRFGGWVGWSLGLGSMSRHGEGGALRVIPLPQLPPPGACGQVPLLFCNLSCSTGDSHICLSYFPNLVLNLGVVGRPWGADPREEAVGSGRDVRGPPLGPEGPDGTPGRLPVLLGCAVQQCPLPSPRSPTSLF